MSAHKVLDDKPTSKQETTREVLERLKGRVRELKSRETPAGYMASGTAYAAFEQCEDAIDEELEKL